VFIFIKTICSLSGSRLKPITCSGCGQQYKYVATRVGIGHSLRPFPFFVGDRAAFLGARAERKLRERTMRDLASRLERAIDPVPCPRCSILQPNMIRLPRLRHQKEKTIFLIVAIVPAFVIGGMLRGLLGLNDGAIVWVVLGVLGVFYAPFAWWLRRAGWRGQPSRPMSCRPRATL
jgi:hypothetical protein